MDRWTADETLCAAVPVANVFTGRIPQTELYDFPYVSIIYAGGRQTSRSDKTRITHGPVSFHIWVDEDDLETGMGIAEIISDRFEGRCWSLTDDDKVFDFLDEGEAMARQIDMPTKKAWEVVKLFTACIMRTITEHDDECCTYSGI